MSNASKLNKLQPADFAKSLDSCYMIATMAANKMNSAMYPNKYADLNPQNQVLAHGIFFKKLLEKYTSYLIINFNDPWTQTGTRYTNRPMITKAEFEKMPKRYRSIFTKYDSTHYILHEHKDTILTVVAANKEQLKRLLYNARMTIPLIYNIEPRENVPQMTDKEHEQKWLNRTLGSAFMKPAFVPNSLSAQHVSDKQMDTIYKLRDIFRELNGISCTWSQKRKSTHCAADIYTQYKNELTQKNRYLNAQKTIKSVRDGLLELSRRAPESEHNGIISLYERLEPKYTAVRKKVITDIQNRTK